MTVSREAYLDLVQENDRLREELGVQAAANAEEVKRLESERDDIAYRVEHPEFAHLHYDGCPYKPWADKPSWDTPEDVPACTCGEAAKGAYWKGQHLLERGYHQMTKNELAECRKDILTLQSRLLAMERIIMHVRIACDDDADKWLEHRERLEALVAALDALPKETLDE